MPRSDIIYEMSDLHSNSGSDRSAKYANGSSPIPTAASSRRRSVGPQHGLDSSHMGMTPQERREAERGFWKRVIINTILIGSWYLFSISITVVCRLPRKRRCARRDIN